MFLLCKYKVGPGVFQPYTTVRSGVPAALDCKPQCPSQYTSRHSSSHTTLSVSRCVRLGVHSSLFQPYMVNPVSASSWASVILTTYHQHISFYHLFMLVMFFIYRMLAIMPRITVDVLVGINCCIIDPSSSSSHHDHDGTLKLNRNHYLHM